MLDARRGRMGSKPAELLGNSIHQVGVGLSSSLPLTGSFLYVDILSSHAIEEIPISRRSKQTL